MNDFDNLLAKGEVPQFNAIKFPNNHTLMENSICSSHR